MTPKYKCELLIDDFPQKTTGSQIENYKNPSDVLLACSVTSLVQLSKLQEETSTPSSSAKSLKSCECFRSSLLTYGKNTYTANKGINNLLKVNDTFSAHEQHMQKKGRTASI